MTEVWLIVTSQTTSSSPDGVMPQTPHGAYRLEVAEGETEPDAVARFVTPTMLGSTLRVVDADGERTYTLGAKVEPA